MALTAHDEELVRIPEDDFGDDAIMLVGGMGASPVSQALSAATAAAAGAKPGAGAKKSGLPSWVMPVAIGAGVLALAGGLFVAMRKKGSANATHTA